MSAVVRRMIDVSADSWGARRPDWVEALAKACDDASQVKVARQIGCGASTISQVLGNKYPGSMANMEERVRGGLMSAVVTCPALGTLPTHECQEWRRLSAHHLATNSLRVRMFRACNSCPVKAAADQEKAR